jgi:hypothetical protein
VLAALEGAVWTELVIVSVEYAIDGVVVWALDNAWYSTGCTSRCGVKGDCSRLG